MSASIKMSILFLFLILLISGTIFGQVIDLALYRIDIRADHGFYNGVAGYNIYIRKKPGIESVMLTEPLGAHSLRATEWNPVNGNERRTISGVILTGAYARYSIVSSTPQPDEQLGSVFHLFIPSTVVYGNPTSPTGTVYRDINMESQINIRTFDQRFADPNRGSFQNNYYTIGSLFQQNMPIPEIASAGPPDLLDRTDYVRDYLQELLNDNRFLNSLDNRELRRFLWTTFTEREREYQPR